MKEFNHDEKNIFKALGLDEDEAINFWGDFIAGYICAIAKSPHPEDGPKFLGEQIDKGKTRFVAYCFARAINLSGLFEGAVIFNDAINSIKSLLLVKKYKDKKIDPLEAKESFLRNLGISRKDVSALNEEMGCFCKKMDETSCFSKGVESIEMLILRKDLNSVKKGVMIGSIIMGNLAKESIMRKVTFDALFMAVEGSVGNG